MIKRVFRGISRRLVDTKQIVDFDKQYGSILKQPVRKRHKLAVVLHLFYVDGWLEYVERLKFIEKNTSGFDLFITYTENNKKYINEVVRKSFPNANYYETPNRGRDVLPFTKILNVLTKYGYEYVLKMHSKKSTHWEGGSEWLDSMQKSLMPVDKTCLKSIMKTLDEPETGIIGPSGYYYSLAVNFPANGVHTTNIVRQLYGKKVAHDALQLNRKNYGFFAGTMFWARIDAIKDISTRLSDFEMEAGQIDGTFAHALERSFCVIPELAGRKMYVTTGSSVERIKNGDGIIPEWSEDHDK